MANLPEMATYDPGVYQLETTDLVLGGVDGPDNKSARNLANRTKYLKEHVDALELAVPAAVTTASADATAKANAAQAAAALDATAKATAALAAAIAAARVPVGLSMFNNSTVVPAGWYEEDGAAITRAGDPDLWAYAQASGMLAVDAADKLANPFKFGRGDGATTFELPDKRGLFYRVWDHGAGRNPGRALGSYEASQNLEHGHTVPIYGNDAGTLGIATSDLGSGLPVVSTSLEGGSEARPRSGASMSIIKR